MIIADCGELQDKLEEEQTEIKRIAEGWKKIETKMEIEKEGEEEMKE